MDDHEGTFQVTIVAGYMRSGKPKEGQNEL
jgi:hypothetical protein